MQPCLVRRFSSAAGERVRFAPSPTGFLHLGGLRTALFNFFEARRTGGTFILRIEDTDAKRTVPGAAEALVDSLTWAGIVIDEGVGARTGSAGPYLQSQRLHIYQRIARELEASGAAYRCYCQARPASPTGEGGGYVKRRDDPDRERHESPAERYGTSCCRNLSAAQLALRRNDPHVVRFRVPRSRPAGQSSTPLHAPPCPSGGGLLCYADAVYGSNFKADHESIEDAVLIKSDGFPTYHLASVVDDHLMNISLVMRGQEWLPSLPLHLLLYRALGWQAPRYAHLPLLRNGDDGSKLSKRRGDAFVDHYRRLGYMPEALVNFVAHLGCPPLEGAIPQEGPAAQPPPAHTDGRDSRPGLPAKAPPVPPVREVLSMGELIEQFDIRRINRADAIVDIAKLDWFNRQHLALAAGDPGQAGRLAAELRAHLPECLASAVSDGLALGAIRLMASRICLVSDIPKAAPYLFADPSYREGDGELCALTSQIVDRIARDKSAPLDRTVDGLIAIFGAPCTDAAETEADRCARLVGQVVSKEGAAALQVSHLALLQLILRLALTAQKMGASISETMVLLGLPAICRRLHAFRTYLMAGRHNGAAAHACDVPATESGADQQQEESKGAAPLLGS